MKVINPIEHDATGELGAPQAADVAGQAAVSGLDLIPEWLTAEKSAPIERRSSTPHGRARFREKHQVMLALAALCGISTLAAFLLQRFRVVPLVAAPLYLAAYISGGWFASIELGRKLRSAQLDINLLMIVVALGAAAIGAWAEGGTLLFLFSLSNALERFANHRTEQTISSLMKAAPETTWRREGERWLEIPSQSVQAGDELLVKPGELFPVDGEIIEGNTSADESALTGEALPVAKEPGAGVSGGTVNVDGRVVIRARKPPSESAVQRILDLIESAQEQKAPAQRFTDGFTRYYTGFVLLSSVLILLFLLFWKERPFPEAFYFVMTLLVVASPCALVLSIPSAIIVAIAAGARQGILFRGGVAVEKLATVNHFVFDKTGTLTMGELEVARLLPTASVTETELLQTAAAVGQFSTHPLSRAIVQASDQRGLKTIKATDTQNISGFGMVGKIAGEKIFVGNRKLMEQARLRPPASGIDSIEAEVWVARNELLGAIYLRDRIRPASAGVIAELKTGGNSVALVSGDRAGAAQAVGRAVGIDDIQADLKPDEKLGCIRRWQREGKTVAMVGDGINDAPSLTAADIGIGMGARGSDAALEQADVILMHDKIENVASAFSLSRRARRIIRQNLVVSLGTVVLLLTLAFAGRINLSLGVVGHEGSTVLVVLNGLRLLRHKS